MNRHLLISGQGRSGSTLFYSMMQYALDGFVMPDQEIRATQIIPHPANTCSKRPFDVFEFDAIRAAADAAGKRLDMIVMLRDPRDILTSFHSLVPDDYFYSADLCYYLYGDNGPTKTLPGLLPVHLQTLAILKSGAFPQGVFLLKYEHLVADPDRIQQMLADNLDLEFTAKFTDFHKGRIAGAHAHAMNGVRPLSDDRVQKWRAPEHRDRIIDQFTRFPMLHDVVIDLGYEADTAWFDAFRAEEPEPMRRRARG